MNELENNINEINETDENASCEVPAETAPKKRRLWLIPAIALPVLAAAAVAVYLLFVFVGGQLIPRSAETVDLRANDDGSSIQSTKALLRLEDPKFIDLQGNDISMDDHAALRAAFPNCEIHWDVPLGDQRIYNYRSEVTLNSCSVEDGATLREHFPALSTLDVRAAKLSPADYEALRAALPDVHILWSIPIGDRSFDCTAESISLGSFSENYIGLFDYFENLSYVDASGSDSYSALHALSDARPELEISWAISLGQLSFDPGESVLDLENAGADADEIAEKLPLFRNAQRVLLGTAEMSNEAYLELKESFPDVCFVKNIEVCGKTFRSTDTYIGFSSHKIDLDELREAGPLFYSVDKIDLGSIVLKPSTAAGLREAYGDAFLRCEIELYGKHYTSDLTELDLSGTSIEDTEPLEDAAVAFGKLEKVIMIDCGLSNEEMAELNSRHDDVRFVWEVQIGRAKVRTDITGFIGAKYGYIPQAIIRDPYQDAYNRLFDEDCVNFKYCTDIVVMDLGHMGVTDYSFLEYMPNLQYLILADTQGTDFSVLEKLDKLTYLELFMTNFTQTELLTGLKNLECLNLGYMEVHDPDYLKEMTWLKMLWIPGAHLTQDKYREIAEALPDTKVNYTAGESTGDGWRDSDYYRTMRDLLDMYYLN